MGVNKDGDLMFSCECNEPKIGKVIRSVYKLAFTVENLNKIYDKAKEFRTLMGCEILTHEQFMEFFVVEDYRHPGTFTAKGLAARIDDFVGMFWLTDINYHHPPFDASIHYTFFDRRTKGRLQLCRTAIEYIFNTYNFNRLHTQVPMFIHATREFVRSIGFRQEGMLIQNAQYKGQLFNTELSAILKSELLDGSAWARGDAYMEAQQNHKKSGGTKMIQGESNGHESHTGS